MHSIHDDSSMHNSPILETMPYGAVEEYTQ